MTLIELLVAGVISLIAASGMVIVMANTLGTGSQTIQMTRLTQEMRTAMQMMSRELRRANYHTGFLSCWGNVDCLSEVPIGTPPTPTDITGKIKEISIVDFVDNGNSSDCLYFWYDRPQTGTQVAVPSETVAAFQHVTIVLPDGETVGKLQMTTDTQDFDDSNCHDPNVNWVDITDPNIIDIMSFDVSNADSFVEVFNADLDSQAVDKIALTMTAKLKKDGSVRSWIQSNTNASRELTEFVSVRNNTTFVGVVAGP